MSYQLLGNVLTLPSSGDLSASYRRAVVIDTDGKFAAAGAGGAVIGILTDKVAFADMACPAQVRDVAQWELGGTVAPRDPVKSDADGRAVVASAADVAAGIAKGICIEGGTVGQVGSILLLATASGFVSGGYESIALDGATDPSNLTKYSYFTVDGTKTGALDDGIYVGQEKILICAAGTNTPAASITGTFLSQAGAAGTSLAFNAAADMAKLVWTGAAWRVVELTSVTLT